MASLILKNVEKGFGDHSILKSVNLEVQDGEFLTIVGPSGCGKSTLLRVVAGLEQHQKGEVRIGANRVDDRLPSERDVAMVFQSYALYPHLNVADNIGTPLRYRRMTRTQRLPGIGRWMPGTRDIKRLIDQEVKAAAQLLDIEHLLARKPAQLSGGQRQRVALGRAIVRRPSIFLMDEPLSNLDAKLRTVMRAEIAQLHRRIGTTFLYVTHDQIEAMTMSDRVAVMFDGKFEQIDTPERIYSQPATLAVAEFIGAPRINRIDAPSISSEINLGEGRPCIPVGGDVQGIHHVCFRPEAVSLESKIINWSGTVNFIEDMGADVHIHVGLPGQAEPVIVKASRRQVTNIALGNQVRIGIEPQDILLFGPDGRRVVPQWSEAFDVQ